MANPPSDEISRPGYGSPSEEIRVLRHEVLNQKSVNSATTSTLADHDLRLRKIEYANSELQTQLFGAPNNRLDTGALGRIESRITGIEESMGTMSRRVTTAMGTLVLTLIGIIADLIVRVAHH